MQNEEEKRKEEVLEKPTIIIPRCCREGWDSCPHQVKRVKKSKKNVGL